MYSTVLKVRALGDHLFCHQPIPAYNCYQKNSYPKISGISSLIYIFPFHKYPQIIISKQEKLLLYKIHYIMLPFPFCFLSSLESLLFITYF